MWTSLGGLGKGINLTTTVRKTQNTTGRSCQDPGIKKFKNWLEFRNVKLCHTGQYRILKGCLHIPLGEVTEIKLLQL